MISCCDVQSQSLFKIFLSCNACSPLGTCSLCFKDNQCQCQCQWDLQYHEHQELVFINETWPLKKNKNLCPLIHQALLSILLKSRRLKKLKVHPLQIYRQQVKRLNYAIDLSSSSEEDEKEKVKNLHHEHQHQHQLLRRQL